MPSRQEMYDTIGQVAPAILQAGVVAPVERPLVAMVPHPLAVDVDGDLGAVSFAIRDLHPHLARDEVWCLAMVFRRIDGVWMENSEHDNTTTPTPFRRPETATNSTVSWTDWGSGGPFGVADGGFSVHSHFGIAPRTTHRITVTPADGQERDLTITPSNGAWVVAVKGRACTLRGYDHRGELLGAS